MYHVNDEPDEEFEEGEEVEVTVKVITTTSKGVLVK